MIRLRPIIQSTEWRSNLLSLSHYSLPFMIRAAGNNDDVIFTYQKSNSRFYRDKIKEDKIFIKGESVFSANDAKENLAVKEADKQFWRQCKCGQGQFLVPLTTDGAISRPVKSRIGKGQPLMVVAGPAESNYKQGLKMASCNDERRWVKRWRKGLAWHCDQQLPTSAPKLSTIG